jgi:hypothetical protein
MHEPTIPTEIPFRTAGPLSGSVKALIAVLLLIGLASVAYAASLDDYYRLWGSLHFNWLFWSSVAIGMVMFAVALHLTDAQWAWSIRRFALGGVAFLPVAFVLLIVSALFGAEKLFHHWLHPDPNDLILANKAAWLSLPGMLIRDYVGMAVLFGLAFAFAYYSLRPDLHGVGRTPGQRRWYERLTRDYRGAREEALHSRRMLFRIGPVLAFAYAVLWGMIGIDQAMTLEPHWFSTMFPVAFFMTAFHGGICATVIAMTVYRSKARLEPFITERQYHDAGKLVFAFAVFWMYLNWSQYIVIWYGMLPHEQEWFVRRLSDPFDAVTRAVVLMVFLIPFLGLLTRPPKKVPVVLAGFAGLILMGHWLERFMLVMPSMYDIDPTQSLPLGVPEIGIALGYLGLFLACYLWFVRTFPLLPSPAALAAAEPAVVTVPEPAARH